MNAQLARAMIQRTYRGVTPPASITAPMPKMGTDHTTEADRLATFDQSARTVGGNVAPFHPLPDDSMRPAPAPAGSPKPATIRNTAEVATQNTLVTAINTGEQVQDAGSTEEAA